MANQPSSAASKFVYKLTDPMDCCLNLIDFQIKENLQTNQVQATKRSVSVHKLTSLLSA